MLRSREHVVSPALTPSVAMRPRVAPPTRIFPALPDRTIAVRGHLDHGGAAALILEPSAVRVVTTDRSGRRRLRCFTVPEILAIEEHRSGSTSELVLVTATAAISVLEVEVAQGWTFCRELRGLIQQQTQAKR